MLVRHPMPAICPTCSGNGRQRGEKEIAHGAGSSLSSCRRILLPSRSARARVRAASHAERRAPVVFGVAGMCGSASNSGKRRRSVPGLVARRTSAARSSGSRILPTQICEAALTGRCARGFEASADRSRARSSRATNEHSSLGNGVTARQAFARDPAVEEVVWREVAAAASELGYERHVYR